jgi:hypothetical protein
LDSLRPCTCQFSTILAQIASTNSRFIQQSPSPSTPTSSMKVAEVQVYSAL